MLPDTYSLGFHRADCAAATLIESSCADLEARRRVREGDSRDRGEVGEGDESCDMINVSAFILWE